MNNPFEGLRAALFDLDGTLVETHIDFDQMRRKTILLAQDWAVEAADYAGLDILSIVQRSCERLAHRDGGDSGNGGKSAEEFWQAAFEMLEAIEVEQCSAPIRIPGASELLRSLQASGVSVGIVTRNCRAVSRRLVEWADLAHGALLTRDDVAETKPNPDHLYAALAALGESRPCDRGRHLMVGDHWMDSLAGQRAGMRTVGILRGKPHSFFDPAKPDLIVEELACLLEYVRPAAIR